MPRGAPRPERVPHGGRPRGGRAGGLLLAVHRRLRHRQLYRRQRRPGQPGLRGLEGTQRRLLLLSESPSILRSGAELAKHTHLPASLLLHLDAALAAQQGRPRAAWRLRKGHLAPRFLEQGALLRPGIRTWLALVRRLVHRKRNRRALELLDDPTVDRAAGRQCRVHLGHRVKHAVAVEVAVGHGSSITSRERQ
jgi:hypothetical protein